MQPLSSSTTQPPAWAFLHSESPEQPFPGAAMTARLLRLFRDCPLQYHRFVTGQLQEKDTDAFRFGRAVHTLVLDGSAAFNKKFAIGGPINPKTGKPFAAGTKAFEEWLATERISRDKALTDTEADAMITVANAIRSHAEASRCLSDGWPSLVAEADVEQVRCRIHLDWLKQDEHGWLMIDVKTTDDLSRFETDAERYGYLHQFAFQHDVLQALGCDARIAIIAAEKKDPWRVGVWHMPVSLLEQYKNDNRSALRHYLECARSNVWPTGYEHARQFSLPVPA